MKTKLLRKIRKQYSIVYYPHGRYAYEKLWSINKYVIYKNGSTFNFHEYDTKQDALDRILKEVRAVYRKYSRNYKQKHFNGLKVWHNT